MHTEATYRYQLKFYIPLAITGFLLAFTGTIVNAGLARLIFTTAMHLPDRTASAGECAELLFILYVYFRKKTSEQGENQNGRV